MSYEDSKQNNAKSEKEDNDDFSRLNGRDLELESDISMEGPSDESRLEGEEGRCHKDGGNQNEAVDSSSCSSSGFTKIGVGNRSCVKGVGEDGGFKSSIAEHIECDLEGNLQETADGGNNSMQEPSTRSAGSDTVGVTSEDKSLAGEDALHEENDIVVDSVQISLEQINAVKVFFDDSFTKDSADMDDAGDMTSSFMAVNPVMETYGDEMGEFVEPLENECDTDCSTPDEELKNITLSSETAGSSEQERAGNTSSGCSVKVSKQCRSLPLTDLSSSADCDTNGMVEDDKVIQLKDEYNEKNVNAENKDKGFIVESNHHQGAIENNADGGIYGTTDNGKYNKTREDKSMSKDENVNEDMSFNEEESSNVDKNVDEDGSNDKDENVNEDMSVDEDMNVKEHNSFDEDKYTNEDKCTNEGRTENEDIARRDFCGKSVRINTDDGSIMRNANVNISRKNTFQGMFGKSTGQDVTVKNADEIASGKNISRDIVAKEDVFAEKAITGKTSGEDSHSKTFIEDSLDENSGDDSLRRNFGEDSLAERFCGDSLDKNFCEDSRSKNFIKVSMGKNVYIRDICKDTDEDSRKINMDRNVTDNDLSEITSKLCNNFEQTISEESNGEHDKSGKGKETYLLGVEDDRSNCKNDASNNSDSSVAAAERPVENSTVPSSERVFEESRGMKPVNISSSNLLAYIVDLQRRYGMAKDKENDKNQAKEGKEAYLLPVGDDRSNCKNDASSTSDRNVDITKRPIENASLSSSERIFEESRGMKRVNISSSNLLAYIVDLRRKYGMTRDKGNDKNQAKEGKEAYLLPIGDDRSNCKSDTSSTSDSNVDITKRPIENASVSSSERMFEESRGMISVNISSSNILAYIADLQRKYGMTRDTEKYKDIGKDKMKDKSKDKLIQKKGGMKKSAAAYCNTPTVRLEFNSVDNIENRESHSEEKYQTEDEEIKQNSNNHTTVEREPATSEQVVSDDDLTKESHTVELPVSSDQLEAAPVADKVDNTESSSCPMSASKLTIKFVQSPKSIDSKKDADLVLSGRALTEHTMKTMDQILKSGLADALLPVCDQCVSGNESGTATSCRLNSLREACDTAEDQSHPVSDSKKGTSTLNSQQTTKSTVMSLSGPNISRDPAYKLISTLLENKNAKVVSSSVGSTVIVISGNTTENEDKNKAKKVGENDEQGMNQQENENESSSKKLIPKAKETAAPESESLPLEKDPPSQESESELLETESSSMNSMSISVEKEPMPPKPVSITLEVDSMLLANESVSQEMERVSKKNESESLLLDSEIISPEKDLVSKESAPRSLENKVISSESKLTSAEKPISLKNLSIPLEKVSMPLENTSTIPEKEPLSQKSASIPLDGQSIKRESTLFSSEKGEVLQETTSMSQKNTSIPLESKSISQEKEVIIQESAPTSQENGSMPQVDELVRSENKSTPLGNMSTLVESNSVWLDNGEHTKEFIENTTKQQCPQSIKCQKIRNAAKPKQDFTTILSAEKIYNSFIPIEKAPPLEKFYNFGNVSVDNLGNPCIVTKETNDLNGNRRGKSSRKRKTDDSANSHLGTKIVCLPDNNDRANRHRGTDIISLPDNNWIIKYHPKSKDEMSNVSKRKGFRVKKSHKPDSMRNFASMDNGKVGRAKVDWLQGQFRTQGYSTKEKIKLYCDALKRKFVAESHALGEQARKTDSGGDMVQNLETLSVKNLASIRPNETIDEVSPKKDIVDGLSPGIQDAMPIKAYGTDDATSDIIRGIEKTVKVVSQGNSAQQLPKRSEINNATMRSRKSRAKRKAAAIAAAIAAAHAEARAAASENRIPRANASTQMINGNSLRNTAVDLNTEEIYTDGNNSLSDIALNVDIGQTSASASSSFPLQSRSSPTDSNCNGEGCGSMAGTVSVPNILKGGKNSGRREKGIKSDLNIFREGPANSPYDKIRTDREAIYKNFNKLKRKEEQVLVGAKKRKPDKRDMLDPSRQFDTYGTRYLTTASGLTCLSRPPSVFTTNPSGWPIVNYDGTILVPIQGYPMLDSKWTYGNPPYDPVGSASHPAVNEDDKKVSSEDETCKKRSQIKESIKSKVRARSMKKQAVSLAEGVKSKMGFDILSSVCTPISEENKKENRALQQVSSTGNNEVICRSFPNGQSVQRSSSKGTLVKLNRDRNVTVAAKEAVESEMNASLKSSEKEDVDSASISKGNDSKGAFVLEQSLEEINSSGEKLNPNSLAQKIAKRLFDVEKKPILASMFSKADKSRDIAILRKSYKVNCNGKGDGKNLEKSKLESDKSETRASLKTEASTNGTEVSTKCTGIPQSSSPKRKIEGVIPKRQGDTKAASPQCSAQLSPEDVVKKRTTNKKVNVIPLSGSSEISEAAYAPLRNKPVLLLVKKDPGIGGFKKLSLVAPNSASDLRYLLTSINQKTAEGAVGLEPEATVPNGGQQNEGSPPPDSSTECFKSLVQHLQNPYVKAALEMIVKQTREKTPLVKKWREIAPKKTVGSCLTSSNSGNGVGSSEVEPKSGTARLEEDLASANQSSSLAGSDTLDIQDVEMALAAFEDVEKLHANFEGNVADGNCAGEVEEFSTGLTSISRNEEPDTGYHSSGAKKIRTDNVKHSNKTSKGLNSRGASKALKNMTKNRKSKSPLDPEKKSSLCRKVTLKNFDEDMANLPVGEVVSSHDDEGNQYLEVAVRSIIHKNLHLVSSASLITTPAVPKNLSRLKTAAPRKNRAGASSEKSKMTINEPKDADLKINKPDKKKRSPISHLLWRNVRYNSNLIGRKRTLLEPSSALFSWECVHMFHGRRLTHDRPAIIDKLQKYEVRTQRIREHYGYVQKKTYLRETVRGKECHDDGGTEKETKETSPSSLRATASKVPVFSRPENPPTGEHRAGEILNEKALLLSKSFFECRRGKLKWKNERSNNGQELTGTSKEAGDNHVVKTPTGNQYNGITSRAQFSKNTPDCACSKVVNSIGGNVFESSIGNLAKSIAKHVRKTKVSNSDEKTCVKCNKVLRSAKELTRHTLYHLVDKAVDYSFGESSNQHRTKRSQATELIISSGVENDHCRAGDVDVIDDSAHQNPGVSQSLNMKESQIYKAQFWAKHQAQSVPAKGEDAQASGEDAQGSEEKEGRVPPHQSQTVWTPLYFDVPVKPVKWQCLNCGKKHRSIRELKLHVDECAKDVGDSGRDDSKRRKEDMIWN